MPTTRSMHRRSIGILTVARSDFGRYLPILHALKEYPYVDVSLLVTGSHLSPAFGNTHLEIESEGFQWTEGLEMSLSSDSQASVGKSIGLGVISIAQELCNKKLDLLVVLGDRFEMLTGVCAALGFNLPVVHIHGGAVTEGALDELVRHGITKMSHLHLVSTDLYAKRLMQMGEEPWRVHNVGAPGLDNLVSQATLSKKELSRQVKLDLSTGYILLSLHPTTLELHLLPSQIHSLFSSLAYFNLPVVMTYPNSDPGHQLIIDAIEDFKMKSSSPCVALKNAGSFLFANLISNASVMVGNSSSGIVEAASFCTPTVNIGSRQTGKIHPANVLNTIFDSDQIVDSIHRALSTDFCSSISGLINPYGDGKSGRRIAKILATVDINERLLRKKFIDL